MAKLEILALGTWNDMVLLIYIPDMIATTGSHLGSILSTFLPSKNQGWQGFTSLSSRYLAVAHTGHMHYVML